MSVMQDFADLIVPCRNVPLVPIHSTDTVMKPDVTVLVVASVIIQLASVTVSLDFMELVASTKLR